MVSDEKDVYIMGAWFQHRSTQVRIISSLRSCYLIPTVDKPTRVHRTSATLIVNIFISNPDKLLASENISDITDDHFS